MGAKRNDPAFLLWLEQVFPEYKEDFEFFLEMRKQKHGGKVNTPNSIILLQVKMWEWDLIGYNLTAILEHCTERAYRGLFLIPGMEPKQQHLRPTGRVRDLVNQVGMRPPGPRRSPQVHTDRS